MKLKKVLAAILCLVMVFSVAGCSLFSSGDEGGNGPSELKITDEFTHTDPEGLEFEKRYVYWSGENGAIVDTIKESFDATAVVQYMIVYADKDDVALARYTYVVMASEEEAKKYQAGHAAATGTDKMQIEGNVAILAYNQEEVAADIDTWITWNLLDNTSAKGYVEQMASIESLMEYVPE